MDLGSGGGYHRRQGAGMVVGAVCAQFLGAVHVGRHAELSDINGGGCVGEYAPGDVGMGHREFRVVDRYWARGDADLGDFVSAAAAVADGGEPRGGGDDDFRGDVRGDLSGGARRAGLVRLVAVPDPEREFNLAAVPVPPDVGRVRRLDVFHGVSAVLVYGFDSRF